MGEDAEWSLVDFGVRAERWISEDGPPGDLVIVVLDWVLTRAVDPYRGVTRAPDAPNLWHCRVPNSVHGAHRAVHVSYWIEESMRSVVCNGIATLDLPF